MLEKKKISQKMRLITHEIQGIFCRDEAILVDKCAMH